MAGHANSYRPFSPPQRLSPSPTGPLHWPNGACGWRDLNLAKDSHTCGCKTFWLQAHSQPPAPPSMETAFCCCGHHACYHDSIALPPDAYHVPFQWTRPASQQSYLPAAPVPAPSFKTPRRPSQPPQPGLGLYTDDGPWRHLRPYSSLARPFSHVSATQIADPPPGPASQAPSDVTSIAGDLPRASPCRAFSRKVTQQRGLAHQPQLDTSQLPRPDHLDELAQSATEVATPSQSGTPDLGRADMALANVRGCVEDLSKKLTEAHGADLSYRDSHEQNPFEQALHELDHEHPLRPSEVEHQLPLVEKLLVHVQELKHILARRPGIWTSISDLDKRMDALETMSASHAGASVADFSDQFDHVDARLLEVEGKVDELERFRSARENDDHEAASRAAARLQELESLEGSFGDSDDAHTSRRDRVNPLRRIRDVERRLAHLENTGPSPQSPWHVEVVFFPWGSSFHGIWHPDNEASPASTSTTQESATAAAGQPRSRSITPTHLPQPVSRSASLSNIGSEWTGSSGSSFKYARACAATSGTGGRIYQRLHSRGFVRTVPIVSKDARMVHAAICDAFGELLHLYTGHSASRKAADGRHLLAFQSAFVPLRKIHKSSRLRFLATPELASPLLWTADFLDSDVFMKQPSTGARRLFITTPNAYLQASDGGDGCSWQKLRELPRFDVKESLANASFGSHKSQVLEGDANEPCWSWDPKLDPPLSTTSSFASNDSFREHASFASGQPLSPSDTHVTHRTLPSSPLHSHVGPGDSDDDHHDDDDDDEDEDDDAEDDEDSAPDEETSREHYIAPITPTSDLPTPHPNPIRRTVSLPLADFPLFPSHPHAPSKRQSTSFEVASVAAYTKRRRSRSPDPRIPTAVRGRWNMTPRRSREPASPAAAAPPAAKRAATPVAYATPFSNSFAPIGGTSWDGAGDTDMDSASDDDGADDDADALDSSDEEDEEEDASSEFRESDAGDRDFDDAVMQEEERWVDGPATGGAMDESD